MEFAAGIEVTRACNFRCAHCFVDAGRPLKAELSAMEISACLKDLAAAGATDVAWSGGEPLLRRDLELLTEAGAKLGLSMSLATNGFLARRERLRALRDAGLRLVQVSLDAADEPRASRYRLGPRGAFERARDAIAECASLGLETVVCSLLSPESAGELEEMRELCRRLGAATLRYTMWGPMGRAEGARYRERAWASPAMRRFLAGVDAASLDGGPRVVLDCPTGMLPSSERFECQAGRRVAYVCADGAVYPCTALMVPEFLAGNLRERPLARLLRDPAMFRVHRLLARDPPRGACGRCEALDRCNGGCPGRALAARGDVRAEAPACLHRLHRRGASARPRN